MASPLFTFAKPSSFNQTILEETKYMNLLKKELAFDYVMKDYKRVRDILYDELSNNPLQALPILHYIVNTEAVFNYSMSRGPLTVILDNSKKWPVEVSIGKNTSFVIAGNSSKEIKLDPGYHSLVFFIDEINYLEELRLPIVSPPEEKCYLIYNIGRKNSYQITYFDKRKELRKDFDKTRGWPELLRTPECLWIQCTELFPENTERKYFSPLEEAEAQPPVKSIFRLKENSR
jgi:hypothetical protein